MLDARVRRRIDPTLDRAGRWLAHRGVGADTVTAAGLALGLAGAVLVAWGAFGWALAFVLASRLADGLDGAVARATRPTDLGGFLDISADFLFYGAIPLGFALVDPAANGVAAAVLLLSFYVNGATFLGFAILAEKRRLTTDARGKKSLYFSGGLLEGTETIVFFVALCLWPERFAPAALGFAAACFATAALRVGLAWRNFRTDRDRGLDAQGDPAAMQQGIRNFDMPRALTAAGGAATTRRVPESPVKVAPMSASSPVQVAKLAPDALKKRDAQPASNLAPIPELFVSYESAAKLKVQAGDLASWDLTARQVCDLELLMNGGFFPLKGFLGEKDYDGVVEGMRLADGTLWPMPVTLDVSETFAAGVEPGQDIALRDPEGVILAILSITDKWTPNRSREAAAVFGADDIAHPAVNYLHHKAGPVYLGGPVIGIQQPVHYDFRARRNTPNELRAYFRKLGWRRIVAFQTRNPLHRAHQELTFRAAREAQANLLIHPVVGLTKPGDIDHFTRVRCYEAVLDQYPASTTSLSLLNLAMRMGGPREAVWHGIIRRNHGCTHMIVGRDHAGPGKNSAGEDFYDPYAAQELFARHQDEIGVEMVDFKQMVYVQEKAQYEPRDEVAEGMTVLDISGTELRRRLQEGLEIPDWFSFPSVVEELRRTKPPRANQGFTVFFTGFSGSGKSTIANALMVKMMEMGGRPVTLLDGDLVRKHLSSELGFSKEHRDLNIRRIGYVASEITKNGGVAICAPIAPYAATRRAVREEIEAFGAFVEVHVATSIEECEKRDRKGLYKLAREGKIKEFTGISDPYDMPENPELRLDTENLDVDYCAQQVILKLEQMGLIRG